jgi:hypothetical protein
MESPSSVRPITEGSTVLVENMTAEAEVAVPFCRASAKTTVAATPFAAIAQTGGSSKACQKLSDRCSVRADTATAVNLQTGSEGQQGRTPAPLRPAAEIADENDRNDNGQD